MSSKLRCLVFVMSSSTAVGLVAMFAAVLALMSAASVAQISVAPKTVLPNTIAVLDRHKFDLSKPSDQTNFISTLKELRALSKQEKAEKKSVKTPANVADDKPARASNRLAQEINNQEEADKESDDRPRPATKGGRDWSSNKVKTALKAMQSLAELLLTNKADAAIHIHDIQEIDWAMESNYLPQASWRTSVDLGDVFFRTRHLTLNGVGRGNAINAAVNLISYDAPDLSLIDPLHSSFWSRPESIATKDLYTPYGRKANPDLADSVCDYASPHKGHGIHPSFEVSWHDSIWKVKFDEEQSSGPFASRIYWALGFPVDSYDFAPTVKVRWDKRILTKFNARELNSTRVRLAHIPIVTVHPMRYFDPFKYIGYAMLKDGSKLSPEQLRAACFPAAVPGKGRPELIKAMYDKAFGKKIDFVVMYNASWTTKESENRVEVGSWDYNSLGHAKLREVRAMCVLDAWLDNWDARWANNRLYIHETKDGAPQIMHVVSDLGALFGNSSGLVRRVNGSVKINVYQDAPNDFNWTFTHSQPPGRSTVPIRGFMPDSKVNPFAEMNIDDARWMARLIAQLSEQQIKEALIGSGYDAPRARLILEKLVYRRDRMIRDFGLSNEIKPLRETCVSRRFSYDPRVDGPFEVISLSGERHAARDTGEFVIRDGALVKSPAQQAPPSRPLSRSL